MWKPLRRWHFDLALLLGLTIFGTAYYLSIPRPLWIHTQPRWTNLQTGQKQQFPFGFTLLGFSEDDLSFFTCHDHWSQPGQPAKPMINQWEVSTGRLVKAYPFQLPEKDQLLTKESPHPVQFLHSSKNQAEPPNLIFSYLNFTEDNNRLTFRIYQLNDGACLGDTYVDRKHNDSFSYLMQNPEDGHHLAVITRYIDKAKSEARVTDLATGKRLHTFEIPGESFWKAMTSPNGQFLILLFMPPPDRKVYLEVYRMHSWEKLGRYHSPQWFSQLTFLDDTHWVIKSTSLSAKQELQDQLYFYQFDPEARTLTPTPDHPLHGRSPNNSMIGILPGDYFYTATGSQPLSHYYPFLLKVEDWFKRIGIGIEIHRASKAVIREYDLHTGKLLRQQSGLPLGQYIMSNQPRYLANVNTTKDGNNQEQVMMSLYAIPHYLWETTLSWMQWLAWLLVIPWPLRYFIARKQQDPSLA
ncbi:MAG TPA: hypothetical protein PLN21_00460 [Gemmatales bacterium]|nr:hypothetical protein [Gemmatales bacterium]